MDDPAGGGRRGPRGPAASTSMPPPGRAATASRFSRSARRPAVHELHEQVRLPVVLADLVDLDDVRVLEPGDGLGLGPEPRRLVGVGVRRRRGSSSGRPGGSGSAAGPCRRRPSRPGRPARQCRTRPAPAARAGGPSRGRRPVCSGRAAARRWARRATRTRGRWPPGRWPATRGRARSARCQACHFPERGQSRRRNAVPSRSGARATPRKTISTFPKSTHISEETTLFS